MCVAFSTLFIYLCVRAYVCGTCLTRVGVRVPVQVCGTCLTCVAVRVPVHVCVCASVCVCVSVCLCRVCVSVPCV